MTDRSSARQWQRRLLALLAAIVLASFAVTARAHTEHKKQQQREQAAAALAAADPAQPPTATGGPSPAATHAGMSEMISDAGDDRASMSFAGRLLDWLGRLHPVIVHFPIAFFPAALLTAIVGRRRPAFAAPVQFMVVAGGIIAPIAAVLGWLDAMSADPDPLLTVHRWLGTAIGIGGLGLGLWALLRPGQDRGPGMILGLGLMTAAIVVQGWYGGALVHGIDHMDW